MYPIYNSVKNAYKNLKNKIDKIWGFIYPILHV